jgi:hypothetical protein
MAQYHIIMVIAIFGSLEQIITAHFYGKKHMGEEILMVE